METIIKGMKDSNTKLVSLKDHLIRIKCLIVKAIRRAHGKEGIVPYYR